MPDLFSSVAIGSFVPLAYPYSTLPIAPGVCEIEDVTPSLPFAPTPVGQFGALLVPGPFFQSSRSALRCCVKTNVVPLLSARRPTEIGRSGSLAVGFDPAMAGSFHLVIFPRKIPEYACRERRSGAVRSGRL